MQCYSDHCRSAQRLTRVTAPLASLTTTALSTRETHQVSLVPVPHAGKPAGSLSGAARRGDADTRQRPHAGATRETFGGCRSKGHTQLALSLRGNPGLPRSTASGPAPTSPHASTRGRAPVRAFNSRPRRRPGRPRTPPASGWVWKASEWARSVQHRPGPPPPAGRGRPGAQGGEVPPAVALGTL